MPRLLMALWHTEIRRMQSVQTVGIQDIGDTIHVFLLKFAVSKPVEIKNQNVTRFFSRIYIYSTIILLDLDKYQIMFFYCR